MTSTLVQEPAPVPGAKAKPRVRTRRASSLTSHGEPLVWLTGGALAVCLLMIFGLLGIVAWFGGRTFWPRPIVQVETAARTFLGQVTERERYVPEEQVLSRIGEEEAGRLRAAMELSADGDVGRRLVRTENFELTGTHFHWVDDALIDAQTRPEWAVVLERREHERFYGFPEAFLIEGREIASGPGETWSLLLEHLPVVESRFREARSLERRDLGRVNHRIEDARLELRGAELRHGRESTEWAAQREIHDNEVAGAQEDFERITAQIRRLEDINDNYEIRLRTIDGVETVESLANVVRAVPANQLGFVGKLGVYFDRWWEFLSAEPRKANSAGGVWPAIFGTVIMTLLMTIVVVPFGVLAALYLREYAKQGFLVSVVRVAVNNLAGVPSIVFGVFGFGFFCHIIGVGIDDLLFAERLPNPTYGKGGVLWASLTLALLTLPVVIVATEEALSAVPNSMREGSYACGATKWQTIRRIVLPRAQPGIMTGMILAVARGAGEVAPLMLVGAAKFAPGLLVDFDRSPYVFPERSFMHLGFHIYDVGFQSQNSEAARPLVYTTTLLLIGIVVVLNVIAIWIRARLRRRFQTAH